METTIEERKTYISILRDAKELFEPYKNDFRFINTSEKYISSLEKKYSFNLFNICGIIIASLILSTIISSVIGIKLFTLIAGLTFVLVHKHNNKKLNVLKDQRLNEVALRFGKIKNTYDNFKYSDLIHIKYVEPKVINKLHEYLVEGRSDNLKESINLMYSENHNNEVMKKQESILNKLDSASKTNAIIGVATVGAILLTGSSNRKRL
jgi:hypothetical protein